MASVLDIRELPAGTLVQVVDTRGQIVVSARAGLSGVHMPFVGLSAGRYTVLADAPGAPAFLVEFDGRRITGTSDTPSLPEQALSGSETELGN